MCKVYFGYRGTNEIEHVLCACTVDNHLAKARGLSLRTGAQTMLYLSLITHFSNTCSLKNNIYVKTNFTPKIMIIFKKSRTAIEIASLDKIIQLYVTITRTNKKITCTRWPKSIFLLAMRK